MGKGNVLLRWKVSKVMRYPFDWHSREAVQELTSFEYKSYDEQKNNSAQE